MAKALSEDNYRPVDWQPEFDAEPKKVVLAESAEYLSVWGPMCLGHRKSDEEGDKGKREVGNEESNVVRKIRE